MSNRLKPLIGKEGEKEIKSMKKKKRKWRRWRGERGCVHGRLEAASENDGAGTGRILGADGGHGRLGVGEMGEEEIGQNGGLSWERESKVAKASERMGDWKMGGGDGGVRGEGAWAEGFFFFLRGFLGREGRGRGVRAEAPASQKERRMVARLREAPASVVAAER